MKTILITGAGGQLGLCLKQLSSNHNGFNFIFKTSKELDVTKFSDVQHFFQSNNIDWCINCAAYTAVDNAETESEKAKSINIKAVENIAIQCKKHNVKLIHISTDFVFDGESTIPYKENHEPNPINVYGETKRQGELRITEALFQYYIIRTSWLYSEFGSNFMKTMLRLEKEKDELSIVNDQIGTPTYAKDLAEIIFKFISSENKEYGIYNFSNTGSVSWFDFAKEIFRLKGISIKLNPVSSQAFQTLAKRPKYSVLDKTKIEKYLQIETSHWKESLKAAINNYES